MPSRATMRTGRSRHAAGLDLHTRVGQSRNKRPIFVEHSIAQDSLHSTQHENAPDPLSEGGRIGVRVQDAGARQALVLLCAQLGQQAALLRRKEHTSSAQHSTAAGGWQVL